VALAHEPITTSVRIGCSAWPSHVPLRRSFGTPGFMEDRTTSPTFAPIGSRAVASSSRCASGSSGDGAVGVLMARPYLVRATRARGTPLGPRGGLGALAPEA
jgi:hypothetical protein